MEGLDAARIDQLIPHSGTMCLLAEITEWDDETIHARAESHRAPDNPLRHAGRLAAINAVEYAAQAMAVHGALRAGDTVGRPGYLAAVRSLQLHADRLDDLGDDLYVACQRIMGDDNGIMYTFSVMANGDVCAEGRAMVLFADQEEV
ncbi:3-hydroxylacyl-ACP dehydratase [Ectothiorhodospiraceae bacterium WFHF3C12]|nr:3-hydroxylacyl-ACP dehydratase [Ectothiorhodospiraceae bacterium WFHF3C12]